MKIKAKASFIHGSTSFKRGATAEVTAPTAEGLIRSGLAVPADAPKADKPEPKAAKGKSKK